MFKGHLGPLVRATLPTAAPIIAPRLPDDPTRRVLSLGPPSMKSVPLESATHGRVHVYMSQNLLAVQEGKRFRLSTRAYGYHVFDREPATTDEPLFRWEYVADPGAGKWCRHHFHVGRVVGEARGPILLPLGNATADLNHLHIPTGFVLIEHVIRFLINDLGVVPARDDWEATLSASEEAFFRKFSSKSSTP